MGVISYLVKSGPFWYHGGIMDIPEDYNKEPFLLRCPIWALIGMVMAISILLTLILFAIVPRYDYYYKQANDTEWQQADYCYKDKTIKQFVCHKDGQTFTVNSIYRERHQ